MKKVAVMMVLVMAVVCFLSADDNVNFDKIRAAHIVAMKYYGHAPLTAEKNAKMAFMAIDKGIASVCYGNEMASAYMELKDVKYYWSVEKTKDGILISSKANNKGVKYSRTVEITISNAEVAIKQRPDLDEGSRVSCDWGCLAKKFLGCISCLTDWKCWLTCAGPGIWECCKM